MALFQDSTQAANWTLSPAVVRSRRQRAHAQAVGARPPDPPPLSLEDERVVRTHHEHRLSRFVRQINFPPKVSATAIAYFKRYFLDRSVMDHNPSVVALSALYAAMKVEEVLMSADDLVSRVDIILNGVSAELDVAATPMSVDATAMRMPPDVLLNTELAFLQQLHFHLICYHPYRSLGIVREMLLQKSVVATDVLDAIMHQAESLINRRALLSDLPLEHPPAVLAIAATAVGGDEQNADTRAIVAACTADEAVQERVRAAVAVIAELPDRPGEAEVLKVAELEKRRQRLAKRANDPLSEEYKAMEMEKLAEEDELERARSRHFQEKLRQKTEALLGYSESDPPRKKLKVDA